MKSLFSLLFILAVIPALAQPGKSAPATGPNYSFIDYQKTFPHPEESFRKKEDTLRKQFEEKKLVWPAKFMYIRSFKYDSKMEVWVKDEMSAPFKLFKTYKICVLAGTLGPKRLE